MSLAGDHPLPPLGRSRRAKICLTCCGGGVSFPCADLILIQLAGALQIQLKRSSNPFWLRELNGFLLFCIRFDPPYGSGGFSPTCGPGHFGNAAKQEHRHGSHPRRTRLRPRGGHDASRSRGDARLYVTYPLARRPHRVRKAQFTLPLPAMRRLADCLLAACGEQQTAMAAAAGPSKTTAVKPQST